MAATDDDSAGAAIAAHVADFYNRHPYPPPVADLTGYARMWDDQRRRADAYLFWPGEAYRDDRNILVAGCGTSQAVKYAMRWPKARVMGIDFSEASIQQTTKLKRRHSIRNLELHQLPIERANELDLTFDHIVCTGVLHHLRDPESGLRTLRGLLASRGAMRLMVYAPYGRTGIYMLQEYCRRLGIGTNSADIAELATSLRSLPPDHPVAPLLRSARDFATEAGLADALLHPQDRAYSVPQLFELLAAAKLTFGRWIRQAAYLPHCGSLVQSPHCATTAALPPQEQFAAVELFRGSMVEHSLIAYAETNPNPQPIQFDGDDWLDFIPIRVPGTIVVEERLPPSAVAVLINPAHSFTDIYLPITAEQKRLFDSIDGRRTIGQIAEEDDSRFVALTLFERLWNYDQVVFASPRSSHG